MKPSTTNITLGYLLGALSGARFGVGVWVLYYLLFTNFAGIGLVEALMILAAFTLEIPTGALADVMGRKRTLQLSFLLYALSYLLLGLTQNFAMLCGTLLVFSLARSLFSGTYEAFLYDSLKMEHREAAYATVIARAHGYRLALLAAATATGGYLYAINPRYPFLASCLAFGTGFLVAGGLQEPKVAREAFSARAFWATARDGWDRLWKPLKSANIISFLVFSGMFFVIIDEIADDVLAVAFGFSEVQLGWLFAGVFLVAAFAARASALLQHRLGRGRLLLGIGLVSACTLCLSPMVGLVIGGLTIVVRYALRSILVNVESEVINAFADASSRATVLSTFAMIKSLPYVVLAVGIGALMDRWGAVTFALGLGGIMLLFVLVGASWVNRQPSLD